MQKEKGKNQSMVRQINQRLVLDLLIKGSKSCTDLAKELKLSNTAVAKIVGELKEHGIVCLDDNGPSSGELGRKPILFRLNGDFAMTAVVDIVENTVLVSDMAGTILAFSELGQLHMYNEKSIAALVSELRKLCNGIPDKNLIAVCAVTSGILDPVTGEYIFANRFENFKGLNLQNIFREAFQVPVAVVNDTKVGLIAEQTQGLLQRANNAVFMNIDTGIAAALMINGVSYGGDKGFAGEVGLVVNERGGSTLENRASLAAIRQQVLKKIEEGKCSLPAEHLHTRDIIRAFLSGEPEVRAIVLESAEHVAYAIRNIVHVLDSQVVISGRVTGFGEDYLKIIEDHMKECDYLNVKVQFSALGKVEAGKFGGIKVATALGFDTVLRK